MNTKDKNYTFIQKARKVHGDRYDYSKVEYVNNYTKVCIICPEHGEFWQTPNNHLHGFHCFLCNKSLNSNKEDFIKKSIKIHGNKYNYSKVDYINSRTKVCIICPEHGEFWQTPNSHLQGCGCPLCSKTKKKNTNGFIQKAKQVHGDKYDYSKVNYVNSQTKVCIICPEHGEFWQTPNSHLQGCGCPKCSKDITQYKLSSNLTDFINKSILEHKNKYNYTNSVYINNITKICIICPEHGEFWQVPHNHLQGKGCPKCAIRLSKGENDINDYVKSLNFTTICSDRDIIKPQELDIYIPEKNIAIEYNGLLWHSELYKENAMQYHLHKTQKCQEKGIRLIHIFEDEWHEKPQIVKSRLNAILGIKHNKIRAHKCIINDVDSKTAMQFLDENHLQGRCKAKYHYGLYYKGELVSLMTFGKIRQQRKYHEDYDEKWELLRFANKLNTTVYGGASKLLKHFINEVHPKSIISYADKRWSNGNLYKALGFTHIHDSKPNYFYVVGQHRENRFKYRKGELIKQGFDINKSEHEIMLERGVYRIYDCGTMVFEMKIGKS